MSLNVGTLSGILELDSNPFDKALDRSMQTGAERATRIGSAMTKGVTLPLVGAGVAAVKLGTDFDTSMSRMVGLVGLSTDEVGKLKTGIMDLSGETAKSPQELADAMFTVTSAGFRGAEAMGVLEAAAKASAAGLGETRTIAEALTGAVNAYGPEVLDAAHATDVLVATARAGNFESSQLAGVLGKITPFAKQAGASLEDVGGSIALLTRVNNNATESGTQVAAMLRAFVVPTEEAKKEMEGLYGSTENFRKLIAERGLVAALQDLDGKLGGNREQLGKILGSSEAASAAFQILEADASVLEGTFGTVADAAGMTDEAFNAASETAGFKMQKALAELQAALISAGDVIIPFVATIAGGMATAADAFSMLPGPVQTLLVAFAGLLAAVGPVMSIAGKVAASWAVISGVFDKVAISAYNASGALGAMALSAAAVMAAVAAVTVAVKRYGDEMDSASSDGEAAGRRIVGTFDATKASADEFAGEMNRLGAAHSEMIDNANRAKNPFLKERYLEAAEAIAVQRREMDVTWESAFKLRDELGITGDEALRMATNTDVMSEATNEATGEIDSATAALAAEEAQIQETVEAFSALADELAAQFDPLFAAQNATMKLKEAQDEATWAAAEFGAESREAADANREVVRAALENEQAQYNLRAAIEAGDVSLDEAKATLQRWVAQGAITKEQAAQMAEEFGIVAWRAAELEGKDITVPVRADTAQFERDIAALYRQRDGIRISVGRGGGITLDHEGGRTTEGVPRIIGTYGHEELFVPDSAGTIFSNTDTNRILGGRDEGGGGGGGVAVIENTIQLDGRKIGSSRSVIEGMETAKTKRSRNLGGRG